MGASPDNVNEDAAHEIQDVAGWTLVVTSRLEGSSKYELRSKEKLSPDLTVRAGKVLWKRLPALPSCTLNVTFKTSAYSSSMVSVNAVDSAVSGGVPLMFHEAWSKVSQEGSPWVVTLTWLGSAA